MKFIKFRKKKKQYFLLGLIFLITITLFSVCTIFTLVANTFATQYYKGDKTPDVTYVTISKTSYNKALEWGSAQGDKVRNLSKREIFSVSNNIRVNKKLLDLSYSFAIPIKNVQELNWKVDMLSGDIKSKAPKKDEIWVPKILADTKDIKIGDEISIKNSKGKNVTLKVTALITDSNQPSATVGITYFYVSNEDISSLSGVVNAYITTFNAEEGGTKSTDAIINYINMPLDGFVISKDILKLATTSTPIMIGGIGLVAGILLIISLMLILRANLGNNILKEYKSIGIYKSIGMSSKKIRGLYLASYGTVSIVSSLIGILLSIPISNYMCNIIFKYIGIYSFDLISLKTIIVIFIVFNLFVFMNLKLVLRRINKINPVMAINMGLTSSKSTFKKSLIKYNSSAPAMAINDIFKYKKSNFITLLIFALSFYISILFVNMQNSVATINNNSHKWFGIPKSDLVITASINTEDSLKQVLKYIENKEYAKKSYLWDIYSGNSKISIDNQKYKVDLQTFNMTTYNKYNENDFSITNGRNPRELNEISLNRKVMKANNLAIGDYMELIVNGVNREFLITGDYDSMMSEGQNLICDYLSIEGLKGILVKDGALGLKLILEKTFNLIILDIMLPNMDGIQICRRAREKSHVPIIMISAKSGDMDKILSLGVGADDYVTKPFSPMELIARVKAHLRRQSYTDEKKEAKECKTYGTLKIYSKSYKLMINNIEISLTTREFQLIDFLIKNEKIVFTKEQLCNKVWGYNEFMDGNTIAVYVKRLRMKLGDIGKEAIKTVWGVGYKWDFNHE